ncbi:MAG TPA: N-acetylneuraminate synthase family protein [Tepidisphaeraceae bacterium]|nr:N-acetylneuraminate synthase family protein [Tepidisphaeraceae bacterium]
MNTIRMDGRLIGRGHRSLIIAEIGVNHDGSVERAIELARHAAAAGADAVKLQIFQADTLMHPSTVFAQYQIERTQQADPAAMLQQYELNPVDLRRVISAIQELRLMPLATPFSPQDVGLIESLDLPAIKIASPDLVNQLLLARAAETGRPMIISTGASEMEEVEQTVQWLRHWQTQAVLMHCVSSYPTPAYQAHLCWINELAKFGFPVGYSDHTTDLLAGAMAVSAGACVIEKHLTYDRNAAGPDHAASADPCEFAEYVRLIRAAEALRGVGTKHVLPIERDVRNVSRQSLVLARDINRGEAIRMSDLTVQRPGTGIAPAEVQATAGRIAKMPLRKGTLLQWDMLSDAA